MHPDPDGTSPYYPVQVTGKPETSDTTIRRRSGGRISAGDKAVTSRTLESLTVVHPPASSLQTPGPVAAPPSPLPPSVGRGSSLGGDSSDVRLLERPKARAGALAHKRHGRDIHENVDNSSNSSSRGGGAGGGGGGRGGEGGADGNHPSRSKENLAAARAAAEHLRHQQGKNTVEAPQSSLVSPNQPRSDLEKNDEPTAGTRKYRDRGDTVSGMEHPVTGLGDVDVASTMEGLLDREVSVKKFVSSVSRFDLDVWQRSMFCEAGRGISHPADELCGGPGSDTTAVGFA